MTSLSWGPMWVWVVGLGACLAAGCIAPDTEACASGRICPAGLICVDAVDGCALPEQVRACDGSDDGTGCEVRGQQASCEAGVCLVGVCGDGLATIGEACDDGNLIGDDGCSADCRSTEVCGNGIIDAGEECDCGTESDLLGQGCESPNSGAAGASCRSDCVAHCGDGEVNASEDCDSAPVAGGCFGFGFDRGTLECTSSCGADFEGCRYYGLVSVDGADIPGALPKSIYVAPDGSLYVVGGRFLASSAGGTWTVREYENSIYSSENATAVSGSDDGIVQAVGTVAWWDGYINGGSVAAVYTWAGAGWTSEVLSQSTVGSGIWVGSTDDRVAVGRAGGQGALWSHDGTGWTRTLSGTTDLLAVHGHTNGLVVAVGGDEAVRRVDGSWQSPEAVGPDVQSVWVAPNDTIFAGGSSGVVYRDDGGGWQAFDTRVPGPVASIFGRDAADVYAVVDDVLVHFDGEAWMRVANNDDVLFGAVVTSGEDLFAAARHFTVHQVLEEGWRTVAGEIVSGVGRCAIAAGAAFTSRGADVVRWANGELDIHTLSIVDKVVDLATLDADRALVLVDGLFAQNLSVVDPVGGSLTAVRGFAIGRAAEAVAVVGPSNYAAVSGCVNCGTDGAPVGYLEHFADDTWTEHPVELETGDLLVDVVAVGDEYLALSEMGRLWRLESGASALVEESPVPSSGLATLWVSPSGTRWIGGDNGQVWHRAIDGAWTVDVLTAGRVSSLDGLSDGDVVASAVDEAYHYNGSSWAPFRIPSAGAFQLCMSSSSILAALADGTLGRLHRPEPW